MVGPSDFLRTLPISLLNFLFKSDLGLVVNVSVNPMAGVVEYFAGDPTKGLILSAFGLGGACGFCLLVGLGIRRLRIKDKILMLNKFLLHQNYYRNLLHVMFLLNYETVFQMFHHNCYHSLNLFH